MAKDSHWNQVAKAYDRAQFLYDIIWKTSSNMGVNYGYWTPSTKNLSEAIQNLNHYILDKANLTNGNTLLDAGCGVGGMLIDAAKRLHVKGIGVNISDAQLKRCATNAKKHQVTDQVTFLKASYEEMPIEDASVDAVIAIESLFHAPAKSKFLSEAHRVLGNGGIKYKSIRISLKQYCRVLKEFIPMETTG